MTTRLLIVDDSRVSRMMIRARIEAIHPEWVLEEAVSGDQAVDMVRTHPPDCVTMDMNMPGLSGFEAAERIAELAPAVRVVMLTANIQESSRARADAIGLRFVAKPITDASIRQVIHCLTDHP